MIRNGEQGTKHQGTTFHQILEKKTEIIHAHCCTSIFLPKNAWKFGTYRHYWCIPPEAYLIYVATFTTSGCVKKLAKCKIFQLEREKCFTHSVKVYTQCKSLHTV